MTYQEMLIAEDRVKDYIESRLQGAEIERQLRRLRPQRQSRARQWLQGLPAKVGKVLAESRRISEDGIVETS